VKGWSRQSSAPASRFGETATLLKHLAQHKARAIFFVVGQNVAARPDSSAPR
jgi:hypothetical protein